MEYLLFFIGYRLGLVIIIFAPAVLAYRAFQRQANDFSKE